VAPARGGRAVRARPPGTQRGSSRARCQSAGRQARTCAQARGALRRIGTSRGKLCRKPGYSAKLWGARGALANGATNGLERGGWRVGLRQQADAAPAARVVGDALEEAEVTQQQLAKEARVHLDREPAQVVALLLLIVRVSEDDARALEELLLREAAPLAFVKSEVADHVATQLLAPHAQPPRLGLGRLARQHLQHEFDILHAGGCSISARGAVCRMHAAWWVQAWQ
jgi:hypothetical protein